jgi:hypothetical protein
LEGLFCGLGIGFPARSPQVLKSKGLGKGIALDLTHIAASRSEVFVFQVFLFF